MSEKIYLKEIVFENVLELYFENILCLEDIGIIKDVIENYFKVKLIDSLWAPTDEEYVYLYKDIKFLLKYDYIGGNCLTYKPQNTLIEHDQENVVIMRQLANKIVNLLNKTLML